MATLQLPTKEIAVLARKLAEGYISSERPEELAYFPIVWDRIWELCGHDLRAAVKDGPGSRCREALGFASGGPLRMASPIVIMTVLATLAELPNAVLAPDPMQVERGIAACARQFGLSDSDSSRLAKYVAPTLLQQWSELQGRAVSTGLVQEAGEGIIIKVSSIGSVDMGGRSYKLAQPQSRALLLDLVRHQDLHWIQGFVVFQRWQTRRPSNPIRQFQIAVARLNMELRNIMSDLQVIAIKDGASNTGYWKLSIPPNTILAGDIIEAEQLVQEAQNALVAKQHERAASCALEAFHKDPDSPAAAESLICTIDYFTSGKPPADELYRASRLAERLVRRLETAVLAAVHFLSQFDDESRCGNLDIVVRKLKKQQNTLAGLVGQVAAKRKDLPLPSAAEAQLREIIDLVREIASSKGDRRDFVIGRVIETKPIAAVLRWVEDTAQKVLRIPHSEEKIHYASEGRRQELSDEINVVSREHLRSKDFIPEDYEDLLHLTRALRKKLSVMVVESLLEQRFDVTPQDLADMRRLGTEKKRLLNASPPPDEVLLKHLKWDSNRLQRARSVTQNIAGKINLTRYYHLCKVRPSPKDSAK